MKIFVKTLLCAVLTLGPMMTPKVIAGPPAFGPLPGEYAIGTLEAGHLLTARDGGHHSIDAVITSATTAGPNEKFRFERMQPNYTLIKTSGGYYVSAAGGGGLGDNYDAAQILQTERTSLADDALFNIRSSAPGISSNPFTIQTFRNYYLTALGGGGKSSRAFHTDAVKYNGYWEAFQVLKCGDLGSDYDYAIKAKGVGFGYPLQTSNGGGQIKNAVAFFAQILGTGGAQRFKLGRQPDGSYSLQTSNRINYVTAINGGGLASGTKDWDNLVANRTQVQAWEKFRIVDRGDCSYTIQTTNNWYVAFSPGRGISTRISDPNAAPSIGYTAYFQLIPFL